ncbi:unnamed protein product [Orchesella dallaii]|uniref:Piwi domain-containing protein n=1 Tax=Orchesella dallaii TaxID=48710 RepID=A0ABP1QNT9_9HEXA
MYRDGVGEGQLKQVFDVELKTLSEGLAKLYQDVGRGPPNLTYIVVTKQINTKLMMMKMNLQNPPPGTVVDDVVTLPERHDFYLISCTARQGTVSPCSYNVLRDDSNFDADKLQLITYKLCHMYFNWSGTIAVPAPCQYAHKLAFLTGMNYGGHANANLSNLLHFL